MYERILGIFAKWPQAGTAKTRLCASGDHEWCALAARAFLLDSLQRLSAVAAQRVIVFAPMEKEAEFTRLASGRFALSPQTGSDLGQRLSAFFEQAFHAGAQSVVAVGTDSPTMPVEYVERAFVELACADVVLGPATDGGYYLIGCGPSGPPLFKDVAWSTATALADTVAALADPRCRLAVLPPWYDVDTPSDWSMLCGHIAALRRAGVDPGVPHTETIIQAAKDSDHRHP
jgi:rSAM/selenodomain-associated transferase 1